MYILVLQRIFLDFLLDFLYFPLWWYTGGAQHAFIFCIGLIQMANSYLAPGLWFRNIFVPMFGQVDWKGRIMSFFMRVANIFIRTIGMLVWMAVVACIFVLWLVFPIFVTYMLVRSFV